MLEHLSLSLHIATLSNAREGLHNSSRAAAAGMLNLPSIAQGFKAQLVLGLRIQKFINTKSIWKYWTQNEQIMYSH